MNHHHGFLKLRKLRSSLCTIEGYVVSFIAPIEAPGSNPQVLPAGSCVFKVVDSKVNRNIVQVSRKKETRVHTTILAIRPKYGCLNPEGIPS
jgi:hypothetical protein